MLGGEETTEIGQQKDFIHLKHWKVSLIRLERHFPTIFKVFRHSHSVFSRAGLV